MLAYANAQWVDPGASAIQKVPYNITQGIDTLPITAVKWANYKAEIDLTRPVVCSFDKWVTLTPPPVPVTIDGFEAYNIDQYTNWDLSMEFGHTVVGVGYIDITPGFQNNGQDEFFVAQDGWNTTIQYVAVPMDTFWQQSDYVFSVSTIIPEPAGLGLIGMALLVVRRKRT